MTTRVELDELPQFHYTFYVATVQTDHNENSSDFPQELKFPGLSQRKPGRFFDKQRHPELQELGDNRKSLFHQGDDNNTIHRDIVHDLLNTAKIRYETMGTAHLLSPPEVDITDSDTPYFPSGDAAMIQQGGKMLPAVNAGT